MIRLRVRVIENIAILRLIEGTYEELQKINIPGIRGLGGFTIQETLSYLINTKDGKYVVYNFITSNEAQDFKSKLKESVKEINNGQNGVKVLKEIKKVK